jgi:hypothetical protein
LQSAQQQANMPQDELAGPPEQEIPQGWS